LEESYDSIVPVKVGNWENRDPLEGRGEQTGALVEGDMTVLRDRASMSTELDRLA